jgi:hypothetical protein
VVGSCFAVKELRSLMHKVMHLPRDTSDFVLHTTAVGACENRSRLAELLHKTLEKRYALTIRRFAASKTADGVRQLWREATASGVELPGALWAAWTHPACDSLLEHEIYGDIHMIQHQVGTGARADLKTLQALRTENAELRRQVDVLRQDAEAARHEKAGETRALGERLTELRAEQAGRDACIARLSAELSGCATACRNCVSARPWPAAPKMPTHAPPPSPPSAASRPKPWSACSAGSLSSPQPQAPAGSRLPPASTDETCLRPPANRSTASAYSVSAAVPGRWAPTARRSSARAGASCTTTAAWRKACTVSTVPWPQPISSSARPAASATTPIGA